MKKIPALIMAFVVMVSCLFMGSVSVAANKNNDDIVIVIDPGHGGADPGAQGTTGVYEKECNLAIAQAMKDELLTYEGVKVYLTRSGDEWTTNTARAMTAAALNADFLISIHNNSGSSTNTGALAYRTVNSYYSEMTNDMCNLILDYLVGIGLHNGGVQTRLSTQYNNEDYYTIIAEGVRGGVPTIIVEHCFLSNTEDASQISNEDGTVNKDAVKAMGVADATAVATYYSLSKRTAVADDATTVTLEKSYSVTVTAPGSTGKEVSWYSVDSRVATVSDEGVVTAVGEGTTNVVYKFSDGTSGSCTIEVTPSKAVALVGAIDPTFYDNDDNFSNIDFDSAFGFVINSDGTSAKVKLDSVEEVDLSITGVQDLTVKYGQMEGKLRIIHNTSDYIPQVTLPVETEPQETTISEDNTSNTETSPAEDNKNTDPKDNLITILKFVIVFLVILIIGLVIFIIESRKRGRRGYNRRRGRHRRY